MENLNLFYQDIVPSSSAGGYLTQEEAAKEALTIRISQKFALLEEERHVIETMAYHDKYKKILDEIWKNKVELDGKTVERRWRNQPKEHTIMRPDHHDPNAQDNTKQWKNYCFHKFTTSFCYRKGVSEKLSLGWDYIKRFEMDNLWVLTEDVGKLILEDPQLGVPRVGIPRPPMASMQDLYDRIDRIEICQDAMERMEYRQSYHWDIYHGVFEHMVGVYIVPLQGAYNPPGYAQPQYDPEKEEKARDELAQRKDLEYRSQLKNTQDKDIITPCLSDLLKKSVRIYSNTTIRQDERVQSYCGLTITETDAGCLGVLVTYHNIVPPSHQCRNCHATMWYEEREEKSKTVANLTFLLCCQGGKVLLPIFKEGIQPKFAQLYFFDTQNEVRNRTRAFINKDTAEPVDEQIVQSLIQMLDEYSLVAKAFRMTRDWCNTHNTIDFHPRLHSNKKITRQYNALTVSEVAAIIINDFGDDLPTRDIHMSVYLTDTQDKDRITPSLLDLLKKSLRIHSNTTIRQDGRVQSYCGLTITETDAGCLGTTQPGYTLLTGGRLFQQYLVDAYTAVEEKRLKWTRNNQDTLHVDLYHNLCDAVTRGDTSATGLGKRIGFAKEFWEAQDI
ncbi:DNA helicase PIF1, ATP-dependent [Tanacetum coccineum]